MAQPSIVKYILDKGGDKLLNAKNDSGFTPLVCAASKV